MQFNNNRNIIGSLHEKFLEMKIAFNIATSRSLFPKSFRIQAMHCRIECISENQQLIKDLPLIHKRMEKEKYKMKIKRSNRNIFSW